MTGDVRVNYKKILKVFGTFALIILAVLLGLKVAIFFLPFLIAYLISKIIKRPVNFMCKKFRMKRVIAVIACMLLFIAIVGVIIYMFVSTLFKEIVALSEQTSYTFPTLYNNIALQIGRFNFFFDNLDISPDLVSGIKQSFLDIVNTLLTTLSGWIDTAVNSLLNIIMNFPTILIYIIITILSTFFLSCDSKFITESLEKYLPIKWIKKAEDISSSLFKSLGSYLKAIGILITITFCELLIGFTLFDVKYALILAIVVAIIDALPILGTGTVLIPWGIISIITGNTFFGIGMLGLYLFILIVRQLIEPKIVGQQLGIYPLLTLLAMYTGVKFVGLAGVIIGPVVLVIFKNVLSSVYEKGILKELFGN